MLERFPCIDIYACVKSCAKCAVLLLQEFLELGLAGLCALVRGIAAAGRCLCRLPAAELLTVGIPRLFRPVVLPLAGRIPRCLRPSAGRAATGLSDGIARFLRRELWGFPLWFLTPSAGALLFVFLFTVRAALFPAVVPALTFSADLPDFLASAGGIQNREVVRLSRITVPEDLFREPSADAPVNLAFFLYEVIKGDTISDIALQYGLKQDTIISFNQIERARSLSIGTVLRIPNKDGLLHTATGKETLDEIAERFAVAPESLLQDNPGIAARPEADRELFIAGGRLSSMELRRVWGELFRYPTRGWISSYFGYRPDPFTGVRKFHNGLDIANFTGTPVTAALGGRVIATGYNESAGNYVLVNHVSGYQSHYLHMDTIIVRKGQWVEEGQKLGTMGNTGYSTGSHLHFSVFRWGKPLNPLTLMN